MQQPVSPRGLTDAAKSARLVCSRHDRARPAVQHVNEQRAPSTQPDVHHPEPRPRTRYVLVNEEVLVAVDPSPFKYPAFPQSNSGEPAILCNTARGVCDKIGMCRQYTTSL